MGNQQSKKWFFILIGFALLLAVSCGDEKPTDTVKKPSARDKTGAYNTLRIVFKWPGDDFGSREDLAIRDRISALIRQRGVGRIIRTGTGMGRMDIYFEVQDKDNANPELEAIIKELAPKINYSIEDAKSTY